MKAKSYLRLAVLAIAILSLGGCAQILNALGMKGSTGADGVSVIWKGDLAAAPASPELNWAYFDTTQMKAFVFDGSNWQILAVSGSSGANGSDARTSGSNTLSKAVPHGTRPTRQAIRTCGLPRTAGIPGAPRPSSREPMERTERTLRIFRSSTPSTGAPRGTRPTRQAIRTCGPPRTRGPSGARPFFSREPTVRTVPALRTSRCNILSTAALPGIRRIRPPIPTYDLRRWRDDLEPSPSIQGYRRDEWHKRSEPPDAILCRRQHFLAYNVYGCR